jgi:ribosomal protein S18 acetylase RimI-like enzyme
MKLRNATSKDANGIALVLKSSYNIDSGEEGKEVFLMEMKKGIKYIVAEEDKKILGIVTWKQHGLPKHGLAELDRIAVLPESRGKGISKPLFDALVKDINEEYGKSGKTLRKLFLLTHANNERAHKFYEKLGMKHETTLKEHYYKDVDEWVYSIFF